MNQWAFVTTAYIVAAVGLTVLVVWAWASMRRAEKRLDR